MFLHFHSSHVDLFAATKMRYYDIDNDRFVEPKPGIRLLIGNKWLLSNEGFENITMRPAVPRVW